MKSEKSSSGLSRKSDFTEKKERSNEMNQSHAFRPQEGFTYPSSSYLEGHKSKNIPPRLSRRGTSLKPGPEVDSVKGELEIQRSY